MFRKKTKSNTVSRATQRLSAKLHQYDKLECQPLAKKLLYIPVYRVGKCNDMFELEIQLLDILKYIISLMIELFFLIVYG